MRPDDLLTKRSIVNPIKSHPSPLCEALTNGNDNRVRELIVSGTCEQVHYSGDTLIPSLHHAIRGGHLSTVKAYIEALTERHNGFDALKLSGLLDFPDRLGRNLWHCIAESNQLQIASYLARQGITQSVNTADINGHTPLTTAILNKAQPPLVLTLIRAGANPNHQARGQAFIERPINHAMTAAKQGDKDAMANFKILFPISAAQTAFDIMVTRTQSSRGDVATLRAEFEKLRQGLDNISQALQSMAKSINHRAAKVLINAINWDRQYGVMGHMAFESNPLLTLPAPWSEYYGECEKNLGLLRKAAIYGYRFTQPEAAQPPCHMVLVHTTDNTIVPRQLPLSAYSEIAGLEPMAEQLADGQTVWPLESEQLPFSAQSLAEALQQTIYHRNGSKVKTAPSTDRIADTLLTLSSPLFFRGEFMAPRFISLLPNFPPARVPTTGGCVAAITADLDEDGPATREPGEPVPPQPHLRARKSHESMPPVRQKSESNVETLRGDEPKPNPHTDEGSDSDTQSPPSPKRG